MRQSLRPLKECLAAAVGGLERRNWCSVMGSVDDDTLFGIACVKLSRCCELQYLQSYCRVRLLRFVLRLCETSLGATLDEELYR